MNQPGVEHFIEQSNEASLEAAPRDYASVSVACALALAACPHFSRRQLCAASSFCPWSLYWLRTYSMSVDSHRKWTLWQPTFSMSSAVAHMQMHQELRVAGKRARARE